MIFLTLVILSLALFGGMQAFITPIVTIGLFAAGSVTVGAAVWGSKATFFSKILVVPLAAAYISYLSMSNFDIFEAASVKLWFYTVAFAALLVTAQWVTAGQLFDSLLLAGWLWPVLWLLIRPEDNVNIVAVWPVVFILVGLESWKIGKLEGWMATVYIAFYLIILLYLGSRGAALGLAAGLFTLYASRTTHHAPNTKLYTLLLAPLLILLLVTWRPETAVYRLGYWQQALNAFLANPLFGVGPGGLKARELITEPGGGFQLHAHNFIISSAAELGLVGLAAIGYACWKIYDLRFTIYAQPWQAAIVTALLCHSLVDEPLYWPGPLFLAALVVGTITERQIIK